MCIQNVHVVVQVLKNTQKTLPTYLLELVSKCLNCHNDVEAFNTAFSQWENYRGRKLIIRTFRVNYGKV